MEPSMYDIRILAERKLKQETRRHNRNLRMILGHFDVLEHIRCHEIQHDDTHHALVRTPNVRDVAPASHVEEIPIVEDSPFDMKDLVVVDSVEVDEDEESDSTVASDEESLPDEDEVDEFFDAVEHNLVRIQSHHSPPEIVGDGLHLAEKSPSGMLFQESIYEVTDDD